MDNIQIAHDLAITKLSNFDLDIKELCEKYNQYYNEILNCLKSKSTNPTEVTVIKSPF